MTLTIREATRADLPRLLEIYAGDTAGGHARAGPEDTAAVEAAYDRIAESPCNTLYVAEQGGVVLGTFQLTLIPGLVARGRTRAKVESVHVHPIARGGGIGTAMMRFAVDEARRRGAGIMELTSNKARPDAHRFYERLGFQPSHVGFKLPL
jgi:GNAT superfamily N-acetyltransferase